ncbi:efflux RND transporter periplasmic adaptor subunit [Caenimonas aquaedulcis]|uniref:HlyD family efflux transporter periplasmic adaptor subunit n=1 Tax=Caenimonas aquaedulcis TaxID=2793270 RepID=A0A931H7R1_9BURK|nr:HlyD family efflux transporter periplasmic adaptor subunit [Caenimonas aquaedulcis]MBG9390246.1 HlyD family efflux transporter periplasmic adaptor subunit [Caenimonas aquaedulcis]
MTKPHFDFKARLGGKAWAAIGILAGAAALAWAFSPRPVDVETAAVERGRFEQAIEEDGRTRVKDRYTISAPVAARMARITLREGDAVAAGDAVAVLTPVMSAMVDDRSMREATARLQAATAGVNVADARIARARVAQEDARLELQRTERLAREGFVAASRLDSARLALDAAARDLDAARAQRDVAAQEREQAAAALRPAGAGAERGGPLVVRSPVAGVVLRVPAQSESTIPAGTPLLDVGDPMRMEVLAQLLTTDAVQAPPGTRAVIERWGGPPVTGAVRLIEPAGFTKVSALGIEEQRVNVLIDLTSPPQAWRAMGDGYRVTVRLITASADGVLLAPVGALFPYADGGMALYRLDGGRARLQAVDVAGRNSTVAWLRGGAQAGQQVIVYPPPAVADGKRVNVRKP